MCRCVSGEVLCNRKEGAYGENDIDDHTRKNKGEGRLLEKWKGRA